MRRLERYLTVVYSSGAKPVILLNKIDLTDNPAQLIEKTKASVGDVPVIPLSALSKTGNEVTDVVQPTEAHISVSASLKDGLSEIFSHDLGFVIAVDEARKVVGTLTEADIKTLLRK